jgi:hypothetical protein
MKTLRVLKGVHILLRPRAAPRNPPGPPIHPLPPVLKGEMVFWRQDLGGQIMPFKLHEPPAFFCRLPGTFFALNARSERTLFFFTFRVSLNRQINVLINPAGSRFKTSAFAKSLLASFGVFVN